MSDSAKLAAYYSCDAELLLDTTAYFDFSLSNSQPSLLHQFLAVN